MRYLPLFLATLLTLLVCASTQAGAISLTDYEFPKSTTQQAFVNGLFNAVGNSADSTEVGYTIGGTASYGLNYRSLPFSYDLSILGGFSLSKGIEEDSESQDAFNILASTTADKYLKQPSNFFGFGAVEVEYRKLAYQDDADDPRVDVEVGAGYGRTINATVLKQAIRMNEDFKKYGVITKDMPDQTLLDVAAIIDRQGEFRSQYGAVEYRKYWYEEMERVIRESGVLAHEGLGAIGIIRIQEILDEPTAQRWHGWVARLGVGAQLSDFDGESGDPRISGRFLWTRPVGLKFQFLNEATLSTVLEDDPVYHLGDLFRVDYELSNRIDWYNSLALNYEIPTADGLENILRLDLKSTYIFYIENSLSFNPEFQFSYIDDGFGDSDWNWALLGSISYRLK
ncbi:MAG: hypothetical protein KJ970_09595 [Candidatus Eisenbacteria bacterium]|uniref:DUF3078 domain-containing protein n=1 Tax=Eiseniibacteriota bacterium TaxID=2212470 RepID=A0A948RX53_UNCEI|nr:hypothetical protein [Candidatus Eisenbacteria bacterium]MBU1949069.1 hypothetical protein [Candidatus Eisenbacteria bacterium]MBU2691172.1 hypothetical protein [Candidatus Eisenbacteria bacterium]